MANPLTKRIAQDTTAAAIYSSTQNINYGVQIRLGTEATARMAVGFSSSMTAEATAATDGYQLAAGESLWLPKEVAGDLTGVYLKSVSGTQNVYILAF
jgi:hypothetical protein